MWCINLARVRSVGVASDRGSSGSNCKSRGAQESQHAGFGATHRGKHVGGYRVNRGKNVEVSPVRQCEFVRARDRQGAG